MVPLWTPVLSPKSQTHHTSLTVKWQFEGNQEVPGHASIFIILDFVLLVDVQLGETQPEWLFP